MKFIANLFRILLGLVFIGSGFVKGIDPLGSEYKFTEYFNAFGLGSLNASALFFSFLLSGLEFLIGICLFLNIKIKGAAWGAWLFMLVFTPLTLILAIRNPVTDCGRLFGKMSFSSSWLIWSFTGENSLNRFTIFWNKPSCYSVPSFLSVVWKAIATATSLSSISVPMPLVPTSLQGWKFRQTPLRTNTGFY